MNTQTPGGPRRRRIAGERRPPRPVEQGPPPELGPDRLDVETDRRRAGGPASRTLDPHPPQRATTRPGDLGEPANGSARRTPGWWGSTASLATLGAALVVLLTLGALAALGLLGNDGVRDLGAAQDAERAAQTAPASAERAAEAILAYDHQTLDADQDAATRLMTDDFAAEYSETFEKVVKPTAEESRATVVAAVKASATVRAAPDRVRVLLFVDQTTVSRANENPQVALNRVEMIMVRDGDSWLVDDITSY